MSETIFKGSVIDLLYEICEKINTPSKNKNNDHKGKYNINMLETFWLLHGNYNIIKKEAPNLGLDEVIKKAIHNYEHIFKEEAYSFIASRFDNIFGTFSYGMNLDKYIEESKTYPKSSKILEQLSHVIDDIKKWRYTYLKHTEMFPKVYEDFDIPWSLNRELNKNNEHFMPSLYPKIAHRLKVKRKRFSSIAIQSSTKIKKMRLHNLKEIINKKKIKKISKIQSKDIINRLLCNYNSIIKSLLHIFESPDTDFIDARKLLDSHHPHTEKLLISMEYCIDNTSFFNYELLIIYLFISHDKSSAAWTNIISRKQEQFIQCLYEIIINESEPLKYLFNIHQKRSLTEIQNNYIFEQNEFEYYAPLTFFKLHKIFVLYFSIVKSSILDREHKNEAFHIYNQAVHNVVRDYITIFSHSSIIYPCYNIFMSNPPLKILNDFALSIPDIAKMLGISKSTIYRGVDSNTIAKKEYIWFWLAISGCTQEFLDGLTSLPNYGSDVKNDNDARQMISLVAFTGIAENMLINLNSISKYIKTLGKNGNLKLEILSKKHQQEITSLCKEIAFLLHEKRCKIETDVEHYQTEVRQGIKQPRKITSANLDEISPNFKELKSILDKTIQALKGNRSD